MLNVSCPQYCVSFCDKTCDVCVPTSLQYEVVAINFETTLIETSVCCSTVQATFAIANKNNSNQYNITSGSVIWNFGDAASYQLWKSFGGGCR